MVASRIFVSLATTAIVCGSTEVNRTQRIFCVCTRLLLSLATAETVRSPATGRCPVGIAGNEREECPYADRGETAVFGRVGQNGECEEVIRIIMEKDRWR